MPSSDESAPPGRATAVAAETLYLANLLLAPGLAFLALWWLRHRARARDALARAHLDQGFSGSLWAGGILLLPNGLLLALGGSDDPRIWVAVIIGFTLSHALLVLVGAYGLSRALAGRCWRYPLIGRPLPEGCEAEADP